MSNVLTSHVADRLGSTLFLAALAHGVIILGITFGTHPFLDKHAPPPPLNVTLVVNTNQVDPTPQHALLIAQINSTGHGSLVKSQRPTAGLPAAAIANHDDTADGAAATSRKPGVSGPQLDVLVTRSPSSQSLPNNPDATPNASATKVVARASEAIVAPPTLAAEQGPTATDTQQYDNQVLASPEARKSILAAYLQHWRHRVERIGTLHFPAAFLKDRPPGNPVLEVAIDAQGKLTDIVIKRSSGDGAVDQAALDILRMAAPFDPLPTAIRTQYHVLRFAYEWKFTDTVASTIHP